MDYEGSKADNKADKKGARKAGVPLSKYENSAADRKADAAGQAKMKPAFTPAKKNGMTMNNSYTELFGKKNK